MDNFNDVRTQLRRWSAGSAAAIAAAYALAWFRAPGGGPPLWHAPIMMTPHLAILLLAASGRSRDFMLGFTRGVAAGTRTGVLLLAFLILLAGFFQAQLPESMDVIAPLILVAAGALGLLGYAGAALLLGSLYAMQFPLVSAASDAPPDGESNGMLFGLFTLAIPLVVAFSMHRVITRENLLATERAKAHADSVTMPAQRAAAQKENAAERDSRVAVLALHRCVQTGCMDSLVADARAAGVTVDYVPLPKSQYWALVSTDASWEGRRYVTDESGILLRWLPESDRPRLERPDESSFLVIADSSVGKVVKIAECLDRHHLDRAIAHPLRLESPICGLSSTTTTMMFGGSEYVVTYVPGKARANKPINNFSLSARPTHYGAPAVRSFLVDPRGVVNVTATDREATVKDPVVRQCEQKMDRCILISPAR